jgi:ADP-ribosylglycohydrolase
MVTPTQHILEDLFRHRRIALRRGALFDRTPGELPLDDLRIQQRIEGMLIGLAVGDALGHATEWQYDPERRHREFGTIVDHVGTAGTKPGRISDDTQMSFWTVECLLAHGAFDFEALVAWFVERRDRIVGGGRNTAGALARHAERLRGVGPPLHACPGDPRSDGRGNGCVMRFSPLLLPHLRRPSPQLWVELALGTFATHGHPAALAATLAYGHLLWEILRRPVGEAPAPEWWLDEFVGVARELEAEPLPFVLGGNGLPSYFRGFDGYLWEFVDTQVRQAWRRGVSVRDACSLAGFGSGADCIQSVPAVLYVLMHHADSFESAVIAAVNDTKDNDTVASIVGAFTGALHGRRAIRRRWIDGISSASLRPAISERQEDRDLIERLAQQAAERFVGP